MKQTLIRIKRSDPGIPSPLPFSSTNFFHMKQENKLCYNETPGNRNKIRIATTSHLYFIEINDIVRIQSFSNYSRIFLTSGKSMFVSKVLAHFDELLSGSHFVRIHRTHLVNLSCIKHYEHGKITKIGLSNDEVLPVSRSRKKILQHELWLHTA